MTPPVIDLSIAPGARQAWQKPIWQILLWYAIEIVIVQSRWQVSSRLRVAVLRAFGAHVGSNVIIRPGTRIKFPWNLRIGDNSWIGEGVWIHNQDSVTIGSNVSISQETMITTGSHRFRKDMALRTKPVIIRDGVWVTSRCLVLAGSDIGVSALITPMTMVKGTVPANVIWDGTDSSPSRFEKL